MTPPEPRLRRLELWLWLVAAFVTWNVIFDRQVTVAAIEFTREQILRYDQGEAVRTIEEAFRPRVGDAALVATAWAGAVLTGGVFLSWWLGRMVRPRST